MLGEAILRVRFAGREMCQQPYMDLSPNGIGSSISAIIVTSLVARLRRRKNTRLERSRF
jgi:hypothetical protein